MSESQTAFTDEGDIEVPEPETRAEEAERRQLAGFFEGEGCIQIGIASDDRARIDYAMEAKCQIMHADLGGFAEAEGSIEAVVQRGNGRGTTEHQYIPRFFLQHIDLSGVEKKFERYVKLTEGRGRINRYPGPKENDRPRICFSVSGVDGVRTLLSKLYPWLGHKQRQARIMLTEIIPMMEEGYHLNKHGFVELMKVKERLDKEKPMGNEDRKYTVEYFRDLWSGDLENQQKLSEVDV